MKKTIRIAAIPLAISLALASYASEAETRAPIENTKHIIANQKNAKISKSLIPSHKQVVTEAVDAFKATKTALNALQNNQPEQALAALEVVSGNLHLLLARDPTLSMIPVDVRVQILEGETDLKKIKKLQDDLDDLIKDNHYQAARPIIDSLVDEMRVTTTYLPLASYSVAIDKVAPLIDAGNLEEAETELITVLGTYVTEQEITPLAIIRAEGELSEAFQLEHLEGLSKQETKNKIQKMTKDAIEHVKVAEALGYGTKHDYKVLYNSIEELNDAVKKAKIKSEWAGIKKSISAFKNKILHPRS